MVDWLGDPDFPERRRAALLRRYAWQVESGDPAELAALIAARAAQLCRMMRSATYAAERVAVLGDDGRYHLRVAGRFICVAPWRGRRKPPAPALPHEQWCVWWTDGVRFRIQPPPGAGPETGERGRLTVRWAMTPTEQVLDPASVPKRQHCPVDEARGHWPPYQGSLLAPIVNALTAALGPTCHACRGALGVFVDHDPDTMLVRGLVCRHCNSSLEGCPHVAGCPWADYLNDPPAAALNLRYPRAALSRRTRRPPPSQAGT
ncbi:endonuclease domain-containing protein [Streptosporangium sp. NPDC023615]|uniref:endonuclease domain-containing protein n=1 Tax=Streptosporangium sp. NPDC023615 TaxID=3154794 RepID=UPI00342A9B47